VIVIGGQYLGWNPGLVVGFGGYAVAVGLIAGAYVALTLSMAEMTSALPFSGA
jgi:ethanolamine permease